VRGEVLKLAALEGREPSGDRMDRGPVVVVAVASHQEQEVSAAQPDSTAGAAVPVDMARPHKERDAPVVREL
jgi:hypothetical protein